MEVADLALQAWALADALCIAVASSFGFFATCCLRRFPNFAAHDCLHLLLDLLLDLLLELPLIHR